MKNPSFLFIVLGLLVVSCNDYLDPIPHDRYSERLAWEDYENTTNYINSFYQDLRSVSLLGSANFGGLNTDGLTSILKYGSNSSGQGNANIIAVQPSTVTPDQTQGLGIWTTAYEKIRRINEFLEGLNEHGSFGEQETNRLIAQARFIRGYIYYSLIKRHGSVILLDHTTTSKEHERVSEEASWDFVEKELDYAIQNLPKEWPSSETGRITKGAALALKSRTMLFSERWQKAATAAEGVINLADEGIYSLADTYENAFRSRVDGNKEAILEFNYLRPNLVHTWDLDFAPGGDYPGNGGKATPTHNFIEEYETKDGENIDWSPWHNGSTTQKPPYEQLEPRFQASVLYNSEEWKGREIESFVNGIDGFLEYGNETYPRGMTTTGYYLEKYMDEQNTNIEIDGSDQAIIEIRFSEVLLNYAEACAMLGREGEANDAIRQVRTRVGLPYNDLTGDQLINKIRHERMIELAFEGHRYWDLRRWRLAEDKLDDYRVTGMKITKNNNDEFVYEVVEVDNQDRQFLERFYYLPIPSSEITNNPAITQIEPW